MRNSRLFSILISTLFVAISIIIGGRALTLPYTLNWKANNIHLNSFHTPEAWGVWTRGTQSTITFRSAFPKQVMVELHTKGFASNIGQPTKIICGDTTHNFISTQESSVQRFQCTGMDQHPEITFQPSTSASPKELGLSEDNRQLGIAIEKITISKA